MESEEVAYTAEMPAKLNNNLRACLRCSLVKGFDQVSCSVRKDFVNNVFCLDSLPKMDVIIAIFCKWKDIQIV
jgi:hypothetical protein